MIASLARGERIGTINAISVGAADVRPGPPSPGLKAQTRLASSPSAGTALVVAKDGDVDFTVAALSIVWNYRLLPSEPVADGCLQLYGGAGVALFFTDVDATGSTPSPSSG